MHTLYLQKDKAEYFELNIQWTFIPNFVLAIFEIQSIIFISKLSTYVDIHFQAARLFPIENAALQIIQ